MTGFAPSPVSPAAPRTVPGRPEIAVLLEAGALNGESPQWDADRQRLFWVDLREPALHAYDPARGTDEAWEMPAWIGCFGLTATGAVVALRTGFFEFDFASGALTPLALAPFDARRFLFNDGKCDPCGRFVVGAMHLPLRPGWKARSRPDALPLWRYDDGGWRAIGEPVQTANGLAWSPDGRTMYHADTERKLIWSYDYDLADGGASNRRVFADLGEEEGGPDGASVDGEGFYWCALFGGGCLLRLDPGGRIERRIALPVRYPSMPAFGGPELKTVFVTSANWPLSPQQRGRHPFEGALLAFDAPVPGLAATRYRGR